MSDSYVAGRSAFFGPDLLDGASSSLPVSFLLRTRSFTQTVASEAMCFLKMITFLSNNKIFNSLHPAHSKKKINYQIYAASKHELSVIFRRICNPFLTGRFSLYIRKHYIFNHNQKQAMSGAKKSVLRESLNSNNQRCKLDRSFGCMIYSNTLVLVRYRCF